MAFDRICHENGITHLLTAPYSPTTTGKVERLHKTMRAEFFDEHDRQWDTIADAQAALDAWVEQYNTERPHRSLGGRTPAERFALRGPDQVALDEASTDGSVVEATGTASPPHRAGVSRWVDQSGSISLGGASYRVGSAFAGQQVQAVARGGLVEIFHAGVLIATHVQRTKTPDHAVPRAQPVRSARKPTSGLSVTRIVDGGGHISFAGTSYTVGHAWAHQSVQVAMVAGSVQISSPAGKVIRVHPARHDPVAEMGAFAVPAGRPRRSNAAPGRAGGVKAKPLPGPAPAPGLDPTTGPDAHDQRRDSPNNAPDNNHHSTVKHVPEPARQVGTGT